MIAIRNLQVIPMILCKRVEGGGGDCVHFLTSFLVGQRDRYGFRATLKAFKAYNFLAPIFFKWYKSLAKILIGYWSYIKTTITYRLGKVSNKERFWSVLLQLLVMMSFSCADVKQCAGDQSRSRTFIYALTDSGRNG